MNYRLLFVALPFAAFLAGCQATEGVEAYDAPKDANMVAGPITPDTRTLAAAIYRDDATWFLKLMGSIDGVGLLEADFSAILKGVRFAGPGAPATWSLPAGWKEEKGTGFRVATLKAPDGKLEVAITRFDGQAGSVLANVNRWRDELGLEPLREAELASGMLTEDVGGVKVQRVDLTGKKKAKSSMRPGMGAAPFAAGGSPPPARKPSEESADGLKYKLPPGWRESSQKVTFAARVIEVEGAQGVKVTFTPLSPQGGNGLENVNRWRQQLMLPPWTQADLDRDGQLVPTEAGPALVVDLTGGGQKLLGAVLKRPDAVWFVKLSGPAPLASPLREPFLELLRSVRFD